MEVEDGNKWGDGGETHDVMCATVLSEVYGIETDEVLQRVSAAELRVIGARSRQHREQAALCAAQRERGLR